MAKLPPPAVVAAAETARSGLETLKRNLVPAPIALLDCVSDFWGFHVTHTLAELKAVDAFASGPRPVDAVARELGVDADHLYRVLRAGTMLGLCEELPSRSFALKPMGRALCVSEHASLRDFIVFMGRHGTRFWRLLPECVRQGKTAIELDTGMKPFDYFLGAPGSCLGPSRWPRLAKWHAGTAAMDGSARSRRRAGSSAGAGVSSAARERAGCVSYDSDMNFGWVVLMGSCLCSMACGSDSDDAARECLSGEGSSSRLPAPSSTPEDVAAECEHERYGGQCSPGSFISYEQAYCTVEAQADPAGMPERVDITFHPIEQKPVWAFRYTEAGGPVGVPSYFVDAVTGKYLGRSESCPTNTDCG